MASLWLLKQQFHTTSVAELSQIADVVIASLKPRTILLLEGPVGAGKTEFVKVFAAKLGVHDAMSPSYAIHNHYENAQGFGFDHVDLYRLDGADELEGTGFWDLFGAEEGLVIIEWPERLEVDQLPMNWSLLRLTIEKSTAETQRTLSLFSK